MGDVILLRTLSRKSLLKHGKYALLSVQDVLNMGKHSYLRFLYYFVSNISFQPDILEELKIDLFQIDKPGIDKVSGEYVLEYFTRRLWFHSRMHMKKVYKIQCNIKIRKIEKEPFYHKGSMQRRNQGHK